jgi:hypothetical protein
MVLVCTDGLEQISRLVAGATTSSLYFHYLGLGCGSVAESAAHTTLHQEMTLNGGARGTADDHSYTSGKSQWVKTWTFTGATDINEIGIFTTASLVSATMLLRHKLASTRTMANGDTLTVTMTCTFS